MGSLETTMASFESAHRAAGTCGTEGHGTNHSDSLTSSTKGVLVCAALQVPADLSRRYFCQLDCFDVIQCSLVCRLWREHCSDLLHGWKEEYRQQKEEYMTGCPD